MVAATARAQTEAEAATLALGHLGLAGIADLNDNNIRSRAAKQFFGAARDAMLREKYWSFASAWVRPAADITQSLGPVKQRYPMPENCLRIRVLVDEKNGSQYYEDSGRWDMEAGQVEDGGAKVEVPVLVTDISQPLVSYIRRIEVVRLWDPVFLIGFSFELASMMARRLGRSRTMAADLHARALIEIEHAATIDSKEAARKTLSRTPSLVAARYGFRSSWWNRTDWW